MSLFRRLFGRARASPDAPDLFGPAADGRPPLVVVGLGNPGARYAGTRHNAGFDAVDRAAEALGAVFGHAHGGALVARGETPGGRAVVFAKPQGFMNRSGGPLVAVLAATGLDRTIDAPALGPDVLAERLVVVVDDLSLPVGALRLRAKGGAGGHNGLLSVEAALGSTGYPRLRVGVGDSFAAGFQADYVLARPEPDEREAAAAALDRATAALLAVADDGLAAAMTRYNGR